MDEYIEREAAIRALTLHDCDSAGAKMAICDLPAADVATVRNGRWIMTAYTTVSERKRIISNNKFACSECAYSNGRKQSNYCPNCGARMDLEVTSDA